MSGRRPEGGEVATEGTGAGTSVTLSPCFGGHVVYSHWSLGGHRRSSGVVRSAWRVWWAEWARHLCKWGLWITLAHCTLGFLATPRGRWLLLTGSHKPPGNSDLEGIKQLASRWRQRRRKPGGWWLVTLEHMGKENPGPRPAHSGKSPATQSFLTVAKRMSRGTAASMGCLGTGPPRRFLYAPQWVYCVIPWGAFWDGSSCGFVSAAVSVSKIFGECFFANCHFLMGYSCWCLLFNYTEFDACYYNWHSALCFVWRTVCNQEEEEQNWLYQLLSWLVSPLRMALVNH